METQDSRVPNEDATADQTRSQGVVMRDALGRGSSLLRAINLRPYILLIVLLAFWAVLQIVSGGLFLTPRNLTTLGLQVSIVGVVALGELMLLISGNFDLSPGSVVGMVAITSALLQAHYDWDTLPTMLLGIGMGLAIGLFHGLSVAKLRIPSFVATLVGLMGARGAAYVIGRQRCWQGMHDSFAWISDTTIPRQASWLFLALLFILLAVVIVRAHFRRSAPMREPRSYGALTRTLVTWLIVILAAGYVFSYRGIPLFILLLAIFAIIAAFCLTRTTFGRHVFAIGGNQRAAKLSGVNVDLVLIILFCTAGLLSAIGGILWASRLNGACSWDGAWLELDAIAACIIGGTSLTGGRGTVLGMLTGLVLMGSLNNGLSILNVPTSFQFVIKGLILLAAVMIDMAGRRET